MGGTGGSVANDTAIRMVHHYNNRRGTPNKKHIISREHAYHGSTYLAMTLTNPVFHADFDVVSDIVHHIPAPYTYRRPDGMTVEEFRDAKVQELEDKILELGPENVAAFIRMRHGRTSPGFFLMNLRASWASSLSNASCSPCSWGDKLPEDNGLTLRAA